MMTALSFVDRRKGGERRRQDAGPPLGLAERRHTLARRALNLDSHSVADWLAEIRPPRESKTPR